MKFFLALAALIGSAAATFVDVPVNDIPADSALGMKVLSQARQLEQNANGEFYNSWVAGYSIKFQGCHHISQWNGEADGEEDVRIQTKRLVRFRLCPSDYCSSDSSKGCSSSYGDYIIDLDTFLEAYFEAKQTYQEFKCEYLEQNVCGCDENGGNQNGGGNYYVQNDNGEYEFNEDMCMYDCYASHNMEGVCMDYNPYNGNDNGNNNGNQFDIEDYMMCNQANFNNGGRRELQNYNWDGNYYIGPYCASQGGAIFLGVFTDDTCSTFADDAGGVSTFYSMTGQELPYGSANVVDMDCLSCKEPQENNNDGNDYQDADEVSEVCENVYSQAGKCEAGLPAGTVYSANNNACNYMEGIKIVRKDGTVVTAEAKANKTASVFVGVFVVAFVLLSAYVYYLKTKLDRASINLSE